MSDELFSIFTLFFWGTKKKKQMETTVVVVQVQVDTCEKLTYRRMDFHIFPPSGWHSDRFSHRFRYHRVVDFRNRNAVALETIDFHAHTFHIGQKMNRTDWLLAIIS